MTQSKYKKDSPLQKSFFYAKVETKESAVILVFYQTQSGKEPFSDWLDSLDQSMIGRIEARLDRMQNGQFGNAKALKDGLFEMKFKSPAFRIYYAFIEKKVVLIISAGNKKLQAADIVRAKIYLTDYRSRYEEK